MNDKLKPVRCGCDGEARTELSGEPFAPWIVKCPICGIRTELQDTEAEAIEAWNRAMGERKAKVENIHMEYASEGDFDIYECGDCGNCGETVMRGDKFCHECSARLEWE